MRRCKYIVVFLLLPVDIVCPVWAQTSDPFSETPPNFKIAFIGNQGLGEDAEAVLRLIKSEGAQAVLHQGDFDCKNDPDAWNTQINNILGADFPYFACIGNHDTAKWKGNNGYQDATYGALFGVFNVNGVPDTAMFYFKNIKGEIVDRFDVVSHVHL